MSDDMNTFEAGIEGFIDEFCQPGALRSERFALLELTEDDLGILLKFSTHFATCKTEISERFSSYMHSIWQNELRPDARNYWARLQHQITYIPSLTDGNYDDNYVRTRFAAGVIQQKLRQPFQQLIFAYNYYRALLRPEIETYLANDSAACNKYMEALSKLICFDISIALDAYHLAEKFALAQVQNEYIRHMESYLTQKNFDSLTGLRNRQSFKTQFDCLLQVAAYKLTTIALIKIGLDHFQNLSNIEGYETGDLTLKEIGTRIQNNLHKDDLIAYWGGDNFIVALNEVGQSADIDRFCAEIAEIVGNSVSTSDKNIRLTCSMGVALYPQDSAVLDDLIKYSDSAMNRARELGGNKFQFFNKKLDAQLNERIEIANEIYKAIEENQFCLYYQPMADLQTGETVGLEALVRWNHPKRGLMTPSQFIAIAEEYSSINQLGECIVRMVCLDLRRWRELGIAVPRVAINVSPKQLLDALFIKKIMSTLNEFDVNPQGITLEITESLLLHHSVRMEELLREIKAKKFNLAMDDFGTGYSALQYLKHYPFDYVKIDQSFVRNILENSNDAAIACAIISMSHNMGIKVIAEGVETEMQCQFLSQCMCDLIQGYYISRPMPAEAAGEFIAGKFELPESMRRITKKSRSLLLVDDEANILAALKRLFRPDGYTILIANSGFEGLEILKNNPVDVIVSDQRMPNMTGVEFLRQAKAKYPGTVRIVLSGYTELQSITDAINEGAIYKFLTKPWDDNQLRDHIAEAFMQKEMFDENRQLGLKIQTANQELATANRQLAEILQEKERQLYRDETSLDIAREALQNIPIPMLGIDEDGMIAFANSASEEMLFKDSALLGSHINEILPTFNRIFSDTPEGTNFSLKIASADYLVNWRTMGALSKSKGKIITFYKED